MNKSLSFTARRHLPALLSIESLLCLIYLLLIPSEQSGDLLLGHYSLQRWILIAILTAATLVFSLMALATWRNWSWFGVASRRLAGWLTFPQNRLLVLGLLFSVLMIDVALFSLWATTTDQSYLGILSRLSPLLLLTALICVHGLVLLLRWAPRAARQQWLYASAVALLISFVQYFLLADTLNRLPLPVQVSIFWPLSLGAFALTALDELEERRLRRGWLLPSGLLLAVLLVQLQLVPVHHWPLWDDLPLFLPVILVGIALVAKLVPRIRAWMEGRAWAQALTLIAITSLLLFLASAYHAAASDHARTVNTDYTGDQRSFIGFTQEVHESGFKDTGTRNQMPAIPYIQAIFFDPDNDLDESFALGKQVNIGLSLVLLAGLLIVFLFHLSPHQALNLLLVVAFAAYIFRAPNVSAEVLFYFMFFLGFVMMAHMLRKPSLLLGIATGIMLALGQLTKAAMIPGIVLYVVIVVISQAWARLKQRKFAQSLTPDRKFTRMQLLSSGLLVLTFLAVFFPYGVESWRRYGNFFYNVSYSLLWFDSWEDVIAAGANGGLNSVPREQLPSLGDYLASHSATDILERIQYGIQRQWENFRYHFNLFHFPIFLLSCLLILLVMRFRRGIYLARRQAPLIIFTVFFLLGYVLLFIWYSPLAALSRFLYSLFIPLTFATYLAINLLSDEDTSPVRQIMDWGLTALLILDIPYVLDTGLFLGTFAS